MDPQLLEREAQASAITEALAAGRRRDGRVVVIEGPPGIGKSGLLAELRQQATGSSRVLVARASRLEQAFAFGVVRQLFELVVREPGSSDMLAGAAGAARSVFDGSPADGASATYAVLHGLHWLALNLAEDRPLVLAVDDLHWCDASSLRFLAYLARRLEGTAIVLAVTSRPPGALQDTADEVAAELLVELLGDLTADPNAVHLQPQPLSSGAATELLARLLDERPESSFAQACFDATDGNPLLLTQLGHSLRAEGHRPTDDNALIVRRTAHRALSRTVLARVGRLAPSTVAVARAIAVLGETATTDLVAQLAQVDPAHVTVAAGELAAVQVLAGADRLSFVHALVRDAIYFDLPAAQREQWHARAARLLAGAGAPVERVASHLEFAPRAGGRWTVEIAIQAAEAAAGRAAPDAAVAYLQRALDEPASEELRPELARRLGQLMVDVDGPRAVAALREAVALQDDPLVAGEVEIQLLQVLLFTGGQDEGNRIARKRLADYPADGETEDLVALYETFRANSVSFGAADPDGFAGLVPARRFPAGAGGPGARARASLASWVWAYDGGSAAECVPLALWAISGDQLLLRTQTMPAVGALLALGWADRDEPLAVWEDARAEAHRTGAVLLHWTIDVWLGAEELRRGNLGRATDLLREAGVIGRRWSGGRPAHWGNQFSDSPLALALLDQGDVAGARRLLEAARPDAGNDLFSTAIWLHAHAHVLLAEGHAEEALAATAEQARRVPWMRTPIEHDWRAPRARALQRLGRTKEAAEVARERLAIAEHWGTPNIVGPAQRVLGEVLGAAGMDHLQRSVELLEGSSARLEYAKSLASLGAALRRERQPTESRAPLERALELARACDAGAVTEQVRTELAASGVRVRRDGAEGAAALTPSERRVADLAASGRTNREVAQELFVTPKTVEVHLSACYRKLGITSRHALAEALGS